MIGVGGDTVEIDSLANAVYVNGQAVYEPYINQLNEPMYTGDMNGPFLVPEGQVFVMGDNRPRSLDSRSSEVGFIDQRDILGKVLLRIYPVNAFGVLEYR